MKLRVEHRTDYRYVYAAEASQHMACLSPVDTACQRVLASAIHSDPVTVPAPHTDVYGNLKHHLSLSQAHTHMAVVADSIVETFVPPMVPDDVALMPWEAIQQAFVYRIGTPWDAAAEFVFASPHVPREAVFARYAQTSFKPGWPLLGAAVDLMQRMFFDFAYVSDSTTIHTPALKAFHERRGVCQDFAHILIACLRSLGLPARYVSGYLLTTPPPGQPRLIGADASHAWAQVLLPGLSDHAQNRWIDLDPTNNRWGWGSPGADYVRVAVGRDFSDVSPLRGVIHGGSGATLSVAVTVEPVDDTAAS